MSLFKLSPIGIISSPYKEKFAIPRQPGLVDCAKGVITLEGEYNNAHMVQGLEQFSHIWLLFQFHQTINQGWKPLVRPPRLGGNKKMGVLATRSTFRPNSIGMSVVKLENITTNNSQIQIHVSAIDLLDGTPIVDIKPYIPYSDNISNATGGVAQCAPTLVEVQFSHNARKDLKRHQFNTPDLKRLIMQVLAQDPRPAYRKEKTDDKLYAMHLYDLNISWRMMSVNQIEVIAITCRSQTQTM